MLACLSRELNLTREWNVERRNDHQPPEMEKKDVWIEIAPAVAKIEANIVLQLGTL